MSPWKDTLRKEILGGGKEAPCPHCSVPRVQRTDYIRCCRCGINWCAGEPLDQDPREFRRQQTIQQIAAATIKKAPQAEQNGTRTFREGRNGR